MTNSQKIADKLIAQSRGILSACAKPSQEAMLADSAPVPCEVPHIMPIASYNALVNAKQKRSA